MGKKVSQVRIRVPATTSNLGPGFDVLGMALKLYNEVVIERAGGSGPDRVEVRGEGAQTLSRGASNLVVNTFRRRLSRKGGAFRFRMNNGIPLARGLGSSAAARLAGILAAEAFSPGPTDLQGALLAACRLEGHPDNAVPAMLGGLCGAIMEKDGLETFRLRPPRGLTTFLCIPALEVSTEKARRLLPRTVTLQDAVHTSSRLALLVAAIEQRRYQWLKTAMQDVLHQPYRRRLIPGMDAAITAALTAGAYGAALSGSGPTLIGFAPDAAVSERAGNAMRAVFARRGIAARVVTLGIDTVGVRVRTA